MPRLIIKKDHGPKEVKVGDKTIYICMCGLTSDPNGLCSGKHSYTLDEKEKVLYMYNEKYEKEEVGTVTEDHTKKGHSHSKSQKCECGGNCGCHDHS